jgi:segregation and condensation protein B
MDESLDRPITSTALAGDTAVDVEGHTDVEELDVELDLDEIGRSRLPVGIEDVEPEDLAPALEAVCFALNRPVSRAEVGAILGRPGRVIAEAAEILAGQLRGRGLMLQRHREELQLVTRPEVAWAVQRALNPERPGRLSRPALETLAIVAYRQPVTRGVLEAIRGVNCDAVLESLERRGLVVEVGRSDGPGQPRLFGTTLRFLQLVGLERIEQLPPLPEGVTVPDFVDSAWSDSLEADLDEAEAGVEAAGRGGVDASAGEETPGDARP